MSFSIARAATILAASALVLCLATVAANRLILDELGIGGASYRQIAAGKDVLAELQPPSLSLAQAYLDVELTAAGKLDPRAAQARLERLRAKFTQRQASWAGSDALPSETREALRGQAAHDAETFWRDTLEAYLPAVQQGDAVSAAAALRRVETSYAAHEKLVERQIDAVAAFAKTAEQDAALLGRRLDMASLAAALAIVGLIAGVWALMRRSLVAPIVGLADYATRLAHGERLEAPPFVSRGDEIGKIGAAVAVFRDVMEKARLAEAHAAEQGAASAARQKEKEAGAKWYIENRDFFFSEYTAGMDRLAAGDLEARLEKEFIKDYEALRARFNSAAERMQQAMRGIATTSGAIGASTREIDRAAEDLSQRNEQQAATLAETAAAVDAITQTVKKTADSAIEARGIVGAAKDGAVKSEKIVSDAIDAMGGIEKSSEQISQIIGVIDEIAFQTNLLALNAGVEAARAGDAGKGFAVVATEVRALAQRSAEAAKEIKELIAASNAKVQDGVALVAETGSSLRRIVEQVNKIDTVVTDIAASAEAQSRGLREVNTAVQEIDQVTQKNAAMSEETHAASRSLADDSVELATLVSRFKIGEIETARRERAPAARPMLKHAGGGRSGAAVRKAEPREEEWAEF